jgi:hypothetical protein
MTAIGINNEKDLAESLHIFNQSKTKLVLINKQDKYNTPLSDKLGLFIKVNYTLIEKTEEFDFFLLID